MSDMFLIGTVTVLALALMPDVVPDRNRSTHFGKIFTARVVRIDKADAITVARSDGAIIDVQLAEINCPHPSGPFGWEASEFTRNLVFRKTVIIHEAGTERHGLRTLAEVALSDGRLLTHELVKAGLAWWNRPLKHVALECLEEEARTARRGMWSGEDSGPRWN